MNVIVISYFRVSVVLGPIRSGQSPHRKFTCLKGLNYILLKWYRPLVCHATTCNCHIVTLAYQKYEHQVSSLLKQSRWLVLASRIITTNKQLDLIITETLSCWSTSVPLSMDTSLSSIFFALKFFPWRSFWSHLLVIEGCSHQARLATPCWRSDWIHEACTILYMRYRYEEWRYSFVQIFSAKVDKGCCWWCCKVFLRGARVD